jgi:polyisoprenoid-binding protein YceI
VGEVHRGVNDDYKSGGRDGGRGARARNRIVAQFLLAACAAAVACQAIADRLAGTWQIDPQRTIATFAVVELGFARQRGRLGGASGTIVVDPEIPSGGGIDVVVDLAAVDTGWDLRDAFLRGERMFDVGRFPVVRFRSTRLEYRSGRVVAADGEMTLHGVTRSARLAVHALDCGDAARARCEASVAGRVRRRDFGMDYAWPLVSDEVELELAISAVRVQQ